VDQDAGWSTTPHHHDAASCGDGAALRIGRRRHPDRGAVVAALEAAREALGADARRAERLAAGVVHAARRLDDGTLRGDALTVWASALAGLERHRKALAVARQAIAVNPRARPAWHEAGWAAYRCADFPSAAAAFETLVELAPDDAEAWHQLARAAWWRDDRARAGEAFARAARLDPQNFVVPVRVAGVEFQRIAGEIWRCIPEPFQAKMANTQAVTEELPGLEDVAGGLDPDVLGFYEGGTALEEGDWYERILIFQRNHEAVCANLGELREEVRRTILHEVGHHFGMDHDTLPF